MFPSNSRSFRKEQIKRRKRLQTKKKPKRDPLLKHLADPEYFGWNQPKVLDPATLEFNTFPLKPIKGNHD